MAQALETGVRQRSRTMGHPAACGKETEGMMEVVDGMKAPEEEIEAAGGVSLLLLLIITAGGRLHVPMAQCRVDGDLPNLKKAAAAVPAVGEVAASAHGVVQAL